MASTQPSIRPVGRYPWSRACLCLTLRRSTLWRGGGHLRFDGRELTAIFAGGFAGAIARAELAEVLPFHAGSWPWATFTVNIVGAFLLGYFMTRLQERLPVSAYRRPLLGTGFCGALTTFSTVQVELLKMLDAHRYGLAAGYATASVVLGYGSVQLATAVARRVRAVA